MAGKAPAGTPEYRVGSGCTYSTIQDAVDAIPNQGSGIIRIRSGTYTENLNIVSRTVDLLGGHDDCSTASASGRTHLDASGSASPAIAFLVTGGPSGSSHALTLDKLSIFEGTGNSLAPGGGISMLADTDRSATATLRRTFVRNNQTTHFGGGIALHGEGTGTLTLLENSQVEGNTVTGENAYGGGLYCEGNHSVSMIGGSIRSNSAGGAAVSGASGGGVYLDGCDMIWFAQSQISSTDDAALRNNTVYGQGGGLYATGGAQVDLIGAHFTFGDPVSSRPIRIHDNQALNGGIFGGLGGAIYVNFADGGADVNVDRGWVYDNYAEDRGGAFYVIGGSLTITRASQICHSRRFCSRVFRNTGSRYAVARATSGGTAEFIRTYITGNASTGSGLSSGHSLMGAGGDGVVRVNDSLVSANEAPAGFTARNVSDTTVAEISIQRSTVAGNSFSGQVFQILMDQSSLSVSDSIVHEPGTVMATVEGSPSIGADCVIWHDGQLGGSRTQVTDPQFVDSTSGLFYLKSGSVAINYCDNPPPSPDVDLDWNQRGLSHSGQPNLHGPYDLGAFELPLDIFSDRFDN